MTDATRTTHQATLSGELTKLQKRRQWVTFWQWCLVLAFLLLSGTVYGLWLDFRPTTITPLVVLAAASPILFCLCVTGATCLSLYNQATLLSAEERFLELRFDVYMAVLESLGEVLGRYGSGSAAFKTSLDMGESLLPAAKQVSLRFAHLEADLARLLPRLKLDEAVLEIIKQTAVGQGLIPTVEDLRTVIGRLEAALEDEPTKGSVLTFPNQAPAE